VKNVVIIIINIIIMSAMSASIWRNGKEKQKEKRKYIYY